NARAADEPHPPPGGPRRMSAIILVIDDDAQMRRFLRNVLTGHGYTLLEAANVATAIEVVTRHPPNLILLDLGLPDGDGVEVLRAMRPDDKTPVIVLSARDKEGDKIVALDLGADDYLTKPFGAGELMARIRVALRHIGPAHEEDVISVGPIRIDQPRHEVTVDGVIIHLTPIEFKLLLELARSPGRVLTHRHLLREVWGPESVEQTQYLRVHLAALRRKIEKDPARPLWLVTEAGVGYRLRDA
ncbi:MAG TPA: response regulator, partial [Kofleriaceae bacterium]|nr:response regulator [Kofleriaceae bacterium]